MSVAISFLLWPLLFPGQDDFSSARARMVTEQIEARGIYDPTIVRVLRLTPRHLFVHPALRSQAYAAWALPIGYGATISEPFIVAWMTELLQATRTDRVLEIGAGSGYQAGCSLASYARSTPSRLCRSWRVRRRSA